MKALGHNFRPYGDEEMICRQCDFVIWKCTHEAQAEYAVRQLRGGPCKTKGEA